MTCNGCPLAPLNNFETVKPRGNINGNLFFIGEAPGYKERRVGYTFVGKAGMLLQEYIDLFGFTNVSYLTNSIKCRPPRNRTPLPVELHTCRPRLITEINNGKPKIIVLLGNTAINQYFGKEINSISKLSNHVITVGNRIIVFAYHPSYILRSGDYNNYVVLFTKIRILYKLLINKYI
jgi:uracil-DNA glycosylase family 4